MELMLTEFDSMEAARLDIELDKDETRKNALEQLVFAHICVRSLDLWLPVWEILEKFFIYF